MRLNLVIATLAAGLAALPASAAVLDFGAFANDGIGSQRFTLSSTFDTQGYRFTPSDTAPNSLVFWARDNDFNADFGGASLTTNIGSQTLRLTRVDGGLFDFAGIDVAHVYNRSLGILGDPNVTFVFNTDIGSSSVFTTSTIRGFSHFSFNRSRLRSVDMMVDRFAQFDNAGVSASGAVPEPASWALMIAGFGMVGAAQRLASRRRCAVAAA